MSYAFLGDNLTADGYQKFMAPRLALTESTSLSRWRLAKHYDRFIRYALS